VPAQPDAHGELRCEITGLAHGGAGVARVDGRVVFVTGALPGETVRAQITDTSHASFWRAATVAVDSPSPDRTPVSCPAAAAGAGCCDLAFGTADAIRAAKTTILADALTRIGALEPPAGLVVEALPGEQSGHGWRIRARLGVDADRAVGFRAVHSNAIVARRCSALEPVLSDALEALPTADLEPGSEVLAVHDDLGGIHLAEIAAKPTPTDARAGGRGSRRAKAQRRRAARPVQLPPRTLVGGRSARYRVGDRTWELPVGAFWQAHRGAAEVFAGIAADWLADRVDGAVVWDLYGGAGVFAGAALDAGAAQVCVVDTDAAALGAADAVFEGQQVRTHRSAVNPSAIDALPAPGAVILDPPRSGAGRAVIEAVVAAGPATIVHVGCDPASFARDVATAVGAGYRLAEVRGLDAFPLTHHVEAMALLLRDPPRP